MEDIYIGGVLQANQKELSDMIIKMLKVCGHCIGIYWVIINTVLNLGSSICVFSLCI